MRSTFLSENPFKIIITDALIIFVRKSFKNHHDRCTGHLCIKMITLANMTTKLQINRCSQHGQGSCCFCQKMWINVNYGSSKKLWWELPPTELVNNDIISLKGEDDLPLKSFAGLVLLAAQFVVKNIYTGLPETFPKRCFREWLQLVHQNDSYSLNNEQWSILKQPVPAWPWSQ